MIRTRYTKPKPTDKESLNSLRDQLDEQISLFVRMSAADENGKCQCISCPRKEPWRWMDCAHFIDRKNMATRFYLPNLSPACQECNRYDHYNHIAVWETKLSPEELAHLELKSKELTKWMPFELKDMISEFKGKVAELRKSKGL